MDPSLTQLPSSGQVGRGSVGRAIIKAAEDYFRDAQPEDFYLKVR